VRELTFSKIAKNEVIKNVHGLKDCCVDAFLYAVFKALGNVSFSFHGLYLSVSTENDDLLRLCAALVKKKYGKAARIQSENTNAFSGNVIFSAKFDAELMQTLGLTTRDEEGLLQLNSACKDFATCDECCRKAFLKGLFVSCGSVSVPFVSDDLTESAKTQRYHMEFVFSDEAFLRATQDVLQTFGLPFKQTYRKNSAVLYLKDSEKIADALALLSAPKARMELENVKIERDLRNNANRQSNCISANIDKAVEASKRQQSAIYALEKSGKLALLPSPLRQMANLRRDNPEATLDELANLANVSKSGARHRLARLVALAEEQAQGEKH